MHQINFIKSWVYGNTLEPFARWMATEWEESDVFDNEDALGVLLMGGEL